MIFALVLIPDLFSIERVTLFIPLLLLMGAFLKSEQLLASANSARAEAALHPYLPSMHECYERQVSSHSEIQSGRVTVRFVVDLQGAVSEAEVISSTFKNPRIGSCLLHQLQQIKVGTAETRVRYEYVFTFP